MPELSRFFGIVIRMYYDDHAPPHFHAEYAEYRATVDIGRLAPMAGGLPPRAMGMVIEWATLHQRELMEDWDRAQTQQPLERIAPLE